MKSKILILLIAVTMLGCSVSRDWVATGGSRADGVVRLSYDLGYLETTVMSEQQGLDLAVSRCAVWGYTGAEAFGGETFQCIDNQCNSRRFTREYQCLGNPPAN